MSMKPSQVFLDSSVIIAGLASPTGGSHEILALSELKLITPCISEDVVREVIRNIKKKLPSSLPHFYTLFKTLPFKILDAAEPDIKCAKTLINEKYALILASAITGKVDWLLSLDKHFLTDPLKEKVNFSIGSPKDFLQQADCW
ncbi:MAG: PIN domain-containing protein [Desulfotomaculaceae bacterium]|nr:PIN domain-containing protein [Desulfotomaculaceae bacterium]